MPVDFLSQEQQRNYGRYPGDPSAAQLNRYFHLDDGDRALIAFRRGDHNRLGYAVQLCTVRFLGAFLPEIRQVPTAVVKTLAAQLGIADRGCLAEYLDQTRQDHADEIRVRFGYRDYSAQPEHWRLVRWLYTRAWLTAERPSVLFDLATARLVERKILLPGVTVLVRLIASVRDRASTRLWQALSERLTDEHRDRLEKLLVIPEGSRQTPFDRLRHAPTHLSAPSLVLALNRLDEVRKLGSNAVDISRIPLSRIDALARHAIAARSQALLRMHQPRRAATLLAFSIYLESVAQDDALDLFDQLVDTVFARTERAGKQDRLRHLKEFDAAALDLRKACQVLLDWECKDSAVRRTVFHQVSAERLEQAISIIGGQARPPDGAYYEDLPSRYNLIRRFLPALLRTVCFQGTRSGQPVLEALRFLHGIEGQKRPSMEAAPLGVVTAGWKRYVMAETDLADRRYYTFCVLERLQDHLRCRDVFVMPSRRWGDPRAKLLRGRHWESLRAQVCRTLNRDLHADPELASLEQQLDEAYRRTTQNLPANKAVHIEEQAGRHTLVLSPLDKLAEPQNLLDLRRRTNLLLPRVDLPEILLEIHAHTSFLDEFTHISEGNARADDLALSISAVLIAEACNIGSEPLVRRDIPALTMARLAWVRQNYIRAETLIRANARLVNAQVEIPLAQIWGGGEVASADGLRFVTPVRTLNAGPNPKYFGVGRGITYYNFTSDQFTGFHGIVIPGTLRDSLFILDGLLEQQTKLQPAEVMSDTAGYSDVVFGLFWMLGYQFSPRLADIGEARFWRISKSADYGKLNGLACHRIKMSLIRQNWDDLLRVAGSLKLGTVSASELMRTLQSSGRPSTLARAIGELGRIAKTLYLLAYLDDENYRRRILVQLNRGEGRHSLARATFHGQRGEIRQHYREGQEDQLGALGLVVNAIVLWNTCYMDAAIAHLKASGMDVTTEDLARLSPLSFGHINLLGRYSFQLPESVAKGQLRPLRDPSDADETEGGDAA